MIVSFEIGDEVHADLVELAMQMVATGRVRADKVEQKGHASVAARIQQLA